MAGYFYELKLDGVRILAEKNGARVSLYYRSGRDATASYPEIVSAVAALSPDRFILDGEIIAFDDAGLPSFERLQRRIAPKRSVEAVAREEPVAFVAFDVLSVSSVSVLNVALEKRRELLDRIVPADGAVTRFPVADGDGTALFALCKERGMEGLVAKRAGSVYTPGERGTAWSKIKLTRAADFVVVAFRKGKIGKRSLQALCLASYADGHFRYRGDVGGGFDDAELSAFERTLTERAGAMGATDTRVAVTGLTQETNLVFVPPEIVVRIEYGNVTSDGSLRHPVFRGVRPDLVAADCELFE